MVKINQGIWKKNVVPVQAGKQRRWSARVVRRSLFHKFNGLFHCVNDNDIHVHRSQMNDTACESGKKKKL